ncbi:MAG: hypothetical protein WAX79_01645, partial [Candidatus Omnitrophota bacterium]
GNIPAESSIQIKERVDKARAIQKERFQNEGIMCNALMSHKQVRKFCVLGKDDCGFNGDREYQNRQANSF